MPPKASKKSKASPPQPLPSGFKTLSEVTLTAITSLNEATLAQQHKDSLPRVLSELQSSKKVAFNSLLDARKELKSGQADQDDLYYYLHKKLDDNYDVIAHLENQILTETLDRENSEEAYRKEFTDDTAAFEESKKNLKVRLTDIDERLYGSKEINRYKDTVETEMVALITDIEQERKTHFEKLNYIERMNVKEKAKLKDELAIKTINSDIELQSKSNSIMDITKQQAIESNNEYHDKLHTHSIKSLGVLRHNGAVFEKEKVNLRSLKLTEDIKDKMKAREGNFQRMITNMTVKLKNISNELVETDRRIATSSKDLSIEETTLTSAIHELRTTLSTHELKNKTLKDKVSEITTDANAHISNLNELKGILSTSLSDTRSHALKILAKNGHLNGWNDNENRVWKKEFLIPNQINELSLSQRRGFLKYLVGEVRVYCVLYEDLCRRVDRDVGSRGAGGGSSVHSVDTTTSKYNTSTSITAHRSVLSSVSTIDDGVKLPTGLKAWDDYDDNTYLSDLLMVSNVHDGGGGGGGGGGSVNEIGCQTDLDVDYNLGNNSSGNNNTNNSSSIGNIRSWFVKGGRRDKKKEDDDLYQNSIDSEIELEKNSLIDDFINGLPQPQSPIFSSGKGGGNSKLNKNNLNSLSMMSVISSSSSITTAKTEFTQQGRSKGRKIVGR